MNLPNPSDGKPLTRLGKDGHRAELITRPRKRTASNSISPTIHFNAKTKQLQPHAIDKTVASQPQRKSPITKRGALSKRRKKNSEVLDDKKPTTTPVVTNTIRADETPNQTNANAQNHAATPLRSKESAVNSQSVDSDLAHIKRTPQPIIQQSHPVIVLPHNAPTTPRPYPTNKANLMPPPNPATLPNIPVPDETNPQFVKYYDQSTIYSQQNVQEPVLPMQPLQQHARHAHTSQSTQPIQKVIVKQQMLSQQQPQLLTSHHKPIIHGVVSSSPSVSGTVTVNAQSVSNRIPPKINILSQQTVKSNINFVDNKLIIKSDSKLGNVFKSQNIVLPSANNVIKSNMIIRGSNHMLPRESINMSNIKVIQPTETVTSATEYRHSPRPNDRKVIVLKMPHHQPIAGGGRMSTIEKIELDQNIVVHDNPIEVVTDASGIDEFIVEDADTYKSAQVAYTTSVPYANMRHREIKLDKGVHYTTLVPQIHQPLKTVGVVYDRPTGAANVQWDSRGQNTATIVHHHHHHPNMGNVITETVDYEPNVIYAEAFDDENITEEYVTTEEYHEMHGMSDYLSFYYFSCI